MYTVSKLRLGFIVYACQTLMLETYSVRQFLSTKGPLTHTLEDENGNMFVAGRNAIMRLSDGLVLEEEISTMKTLNCSIKDCSDDSEDNDVSIFMFCPYKNDKYVLICGTADFGSCTLYNRTNLYDKTELEQFDLGVSVDHYLGSKTSGLAVIEPDGENFQIFSAMDYDGRPKEKFPKVFSVRKFLVTEQYSILHYADPYSENYISLKDSIPMESLFVFVYGFHHNEYTYVLRNTKHQRSRGQISETCSSDQDFRSYVETDISCDGYILIKSAFMLKHNNEAFLYIAFSSAKYRGTAICRYSLDDLRREFRRRKEDCFYRKLGSTPEWINGTTKSCQQVLLQSEDFTCGRLASNTRIKSTSSIEMNLIDVEERIMTSLLAAVEDNRTMFYAGFMDGTIKKYLQTDSGLLTLFTVNVTNEDKINDKMTLSPRSKSLYFTYANTVAMIQTDDCSLHSTCLGCLSDVVPCQWCADPENGGRCINADDSSCPLIRKDFCEPEIYSVTPLSGPTAGGTLLDLTGEFGDPIHSSSKIKIGAECIIKNKTNERIRCATTGVSSPANSVIELEVYFMDFENSSRLVTVNGTTTFSKNYAYLEPKVESVEPQKISSVGRPLLLLSGRHLDIGTNRSCAVAGRSCDIVSISETEILCGMKDEERLAGFKKLKYKIDSESTSKDIEIIQPPMIKEIQPDRLIMSGGLTLTVIGSRLEGMGIGIETDLLCIGTGLSCSNKTFKIESSCQISNETTMFCRTPPVKAVSSQVSVQFDIVNRFGSVYFNASTELILTVVEDPTVQNLTHDLILTDKHSLAKIKGTGFKHVSMTEIRVTIAHLNCHVLNVTDDIIECATEIPDYVLFNSGIVEVHIGNIIRRIGNAIYRHPVMPFTAQDPVKHSEANPSVIIMSAIGAVVGMTIIVVIGMKLFRIGPFKERRDEHYNVTFRNGGSDVLTLDGLSENHATDISQNRQNAYQEQTFLKPITSEDNYDTCTEPLLPAVDEELKLTLERQRLLIDRDSIILGEIIGQGHFGCVYKGYIQTPGEKGEQVVAAKTLHRKNPKDLNIDMFLKEALIMKDFQHRHVMKLIGICIGHDQLPLVVLPYMPRGDLLTYLRDAKNVPTVKDLVSFGVDIANGMCYLSELKFVHRDLAARNCMMDEECHVKVADFGLSRDVYEKEYYSSCDKTTKLPVKWMAPESLEFGMYSSKSDVWSYGVVLWELLTRGVNPYPEVDNWDILKYLKTGRRMSQPRFCPEEMFSIMMGCWSWNPEERPSFGNLTVDIPAMIRKMEHPVGEKGAKINIETTYVNFMAGRIED